MELFHLHLHNNKDEFYRSGNIIKVDKNFNNRLYYKCMNMSPSAQTNKYLNLMCKFNFMLKNAGYKPYNKEIPLGDLIDFGLHTGMTNNEIITALEDAKKILLDLSIFKREMALEDYRKDNCIDKPSRFHSFYATAEEGIDFWMNAINDDDIDIYKIEVEEEPFVTNETLLPDEILTYEKTYKKAYDYFHPKKNQLDDVSNEYLVQGNVKILEKIAEIKRK